MVQHHLVHDELFEKQLQKTKHGIKLIYKNITDMQKQDTDYKNKLSNESFLLYIMILCFVVEFEYLCICFNNFFKCNFSHITWFKWRSFHRAIIEMSSQIEECSSITSSNNIITSCICVLKNCIFINFYCSSIYSECIKIKICSIWW